MIRSQFRSRAYQVHPKDTALPSFLLERRWLFQHCRKSSGYFRTFCSHTREPDSPPPPPETPDPRPTPLTPPIPSALNYICRLRRSTMASTAIKSVKNIVPLLDRVLVQRFKPETKTASGLFLPSSATQASIPEAHVIAAGPGAVNREGKTIPMSVKAGDKVLLPGFGGSSIKVGDEVCTPPNSTVHTIWCSTHSTLVPARTWRTSWNLK